MNKKLNHLMNWKRNYYLQNSVAIKHIMSESYLSMTATYIHLICDHVLVFEIYWVFITLLLSNLVFSPRLQYIYRKRFYNRETNSVAFCSIKLMTFKPSFPLMQLKWLTLFLIQDSKPIMIKEWDFCQSWNPYTP